MKMILVPSCEIIAKIPKIILEKNVVIPAYQMKARGINDLSPLTYTRFVVESLASIDQDYFLPISFVNALISSPLKNQTFNCGENNWRVKDEETLENYPFTNDFKVDIATSLLITRSRNEIATLRMSADTMGDVQMNKTLALIPFLVNLLEKCKLLLPDNALYSICPGSSVHVNAKTEINILVAALKSAFVSYPHSIHLNAS
jgi:hypothetical protein